MPSSRPKKSIVDVDYVVKIAWGLTSLAVLGFVPWFAWKVFSRKKKESDEDVKG